MKSSKEKTNIFKKLSSQENEALLTFPVYITLLAANSDGRLDEAEKKAAIKLVHTKTFCCDQRLIEFYRVADEVFENILENLDAELPQEKESRKAFIKEELIRLEKIIIKLGKAYATSMRRSMKSFNEHISKAHHSVLVDFILPLPIPGLTES